MIVYSKKNVSSDVENLDAKIAVLTTLFKYFNQNPKSFVQCEMIISQIKSFEVKNHFPHLFFCQRGVLFWQPCMSFSNKNPKKTKMKVFWRKSLHWKCLSGREQRTFDSRSRKDLVEKWQSFLTSFRKKILRYFDKKLFLSPNVTWTRKMQFWKHSGNFCQKLEKVSLRDR